MRKNLGKWLLVWPPQAYLLFFFLVPALIMLFASFRFPGDYGGLAPWMYSEDGQTVYDLSVENYTRLTESWVYLQLFVKSFGYALVTTLACLLLAYPVATTLARAPAKWRNLLILLVILPFWSNLLVRVYAWMIILSPSGALTRGINAALDLFGAQPISLMFTPFAVILCMVYVHLPFMILPLYANLEKHDPALLDAAQDLGAGRWQRFWRVTFPLSLPGVAAGAALVFIPVLGMFAIPDLVGGTDGIMIGNLIKSQFLDSRDWPFGSALSIALTGCILLLVALGMGAARARKEAPMRRPYLLWSATALVYLFLYVPLVIVVLYSFNDSRLNAEWVGFTLDWYRKLFGNRDMLQAAANSLVIALVSASVATLLGTLAGVALHRFKLRVLPLLVLTPIAIPELLMGVSLVIFFIGLNMSLGMLSVTLAHITFSVGFVALVVQARMSGMDESLTEAARDLGATPWQSFRLVTLPLIMPGIVAGALMAFTLSIDDFVITFFTAGGGFATLPTQIYTMIKIAVTPEVNAVSTLLMLLTLVLIVIASKLSPSAIKGH
ncbi:ABC transporter permease subunit [Pseudomonas aeruginosa]